MIDVSYVKLKDCCTVVGGATPKRNILKYWGNDVPWVTPKDVSGMNVPVLEDAPEYISHAGFKSCSAYMLPKNSILLTSRAPIGNVAIAGRSMCTNQGFKSLVPGDSVDSAYLYHCIKYLSPQLQALGNGATFKEVSKKVVENFEIPLPALKEQKRIAAILDKADAIRRKRQQAIDLTDKLLRSVFLDMFGDPVTNPKGWDTLKLGECTYLDAKMVDPKRDNYKQLKHVGAERIEKNTGKIKECLTAQEDNLISNKFLFNDRYILYTKIRPYLRKVALPDFTGLCSADIYPVRPDKNIITKEYLWFILISEAFVKYTESLPSRANIPKINRKEFALYKIMIPPIELQEEFSKIFIDMTRGSQQRIAFVKNSDDLFASLTQLAFRGDLIRQAKAA